MRKVFLYLSVIVVLLGSTMYYANANIVYRWVDEKGSIHYSPAKPWGVKYESVNTSFSSNQRDMIEEAKKQKEMQINLANKDKIAAQKELEEKAQFQRLETCVDITFDKMSYQKRRIEDDSIKQKLECEYKFNKQKQKSKYDACILKIEKHRITEQSKLEQNVNSCFTDGVSPEMIKKVMDNHKKKELMLKNK